MIFVFRMFVLLKSLYCNSDDIDLKSHLKYTNLSFKPECTARDQWFTSQDTGIVQ